MELDVTKSILKLDILHEVLGNHHLLSTYTHFLFICFLRFLYFAILCSNRPVELEQEKLVAQCHEYGFVEDQRRIGICTQISKDAMHMNVTIRRVSVQHNYNSAYPHQLHG